ncbi:MAG: hypothetical protein SYC29_02365 [Planctomycetota bacterium]|nr:hypothetical protein [Planctomycetota bacterium]
MSPSHEPSLTGGECGAPPTHTESVSLALGRLRSGVMLCCWLIAIALVAQTMIWALVSFTGMRWTELSAESEPPLIVKAEETDAQRIRSPLAAEEEADEAREPVDPNRVLTKYDRILAMTSSLAAGFGTLAVLALVPTIALGVLLGASSATSGVDKTVSAFGWSLVVALLALPVSEFASLPWREGGLWSYAHLTAQIDAGVSTNAVVFLAQYLLLPGACLLGIAIVGLRFGAGVELGLMRKEMLRLDPALEQEAGNIRPSSLHGGRTAGAMRRAVKSGPPTASGQASSEDDDAPIGQPSPGKPPRRLI